MGNILVGGEQHLQRQCEYYPSSWKGLALNHWRLFPVACTPATGPVQDGGMSGHNNPIKLAVWESFRIEPSLSKPDVLISVGTGTRRASISPRFTSFRHVFFDGCIPRLWRAYMSSFDGESNFRDVVNHLEESTRDGYMRLNVLLPIISPALTLALAGSFSTVSTSLILRKSCQLFNKNVCISKNIFISFLFFSTYFVICFRSKNDFKYLYCDFFALIFCFFYEFFSILPRNSNHKSSSTLNKRSLRISNSLWAI